LLYNPNFNSTEFDGVKNENSIKNIEAFDNTPALLGNTNDKI